MRLALITLSLLSASTFGAPVFLDDQFELPEGFRIHRAADRELTGGSYALTFDGESRLLVGDGTALRRLIDSNSDGVFEKSEVIATGLGWRGPQGILVYGDRLFAVGGDGIQLYEGYRSGGPLRHVGRIGEKLNTGGDHDAHTLLRGHDGCIYFMAGNGSGLKDRRHITEPNSPARFEREASVFRISPDGKKWECIATGGRNPPSLGMNYVGDLFSFDSDMEWHVGLPFYRPIRLNHWVIGGDQGWEDVGALPPYYIDNVPGILDVGRGSPNWGIFYEHNNLPEKYHNAFIVCDYRWKSESTDDYRSTGRLVAFHLKRNGSRWKAEMETLVRPKPGAKDQHGRAIPFALVDVTVGPRGELYFTDHNQGVWRLFFDARKTGRPLSVYPPATDAVDSVIDIPQLSSELSRLLVEARMDPEGRMDRRLIRYLFSPAPLQRRLRALRILVPRFKRLDLVRHLAKDKEVELRAQAAWLAGIWGGEDVELLPTLLKDEDPFVRRRAAEAMLRHASLRFLPAIEEALADKDRTVRYTAMMVLAHLPAEGWSDRLTASTNAQVQLRALAAAHLRNEKPAAEKVTSALIARQLTREDELDLLRVINLYTNTSTVAWIRKGFPTGDSEIDWERARLLGEFRDAESFPLLLKELRETKEPVRQFHYFQSIAKLKSGWTPDSENQLLDWTLGTQRGWFAEFAEKGVEFPLFLQTALEEFASSDPDAVLAAAPEIELGSLMGSALLSVIRKREPTRLFSIYAADSKDSRRVKILQTLAALPTEETAAFLRKEISETKSAPIRTAALKALEAMPKSPDNTEFLRRASEKQTAEQRSNEQIYDAIMAASLDAGDVRRGRGIYERLLCNTCHGGGQTPGQEGRIFGPDLAGATARLTRQQLADALVYPSKEVADRFKATVLTLKDGRELTGFETDRDADSVTFIDASTIHKIVTREIEKSEPQEKSLMPESLLNALHNDEIAHLLKFLSTLGLESAGRSASAQ